jgi:hypothetical protein
MTLFYLAPSYIARQTEQQSAYEDRIAELVRQDLPPAVTFLGFCGAPGPWRPT